MTSKTFLNSRMVAAIVESTADNMLDVFDNSPVSWEKGFCVGFYMYLNRVSLDGQFLPVTAETFILGLTGDSE